VSSAFPAGVVVFAACTAAPQDQRVQASYDATTGKLRQLTIDSLKDGKPNITSYMDGTTFVRIEIDSDEDGKIDRWEYYGADQKVERVGLSRANDGKEDVWVFRGADGSVARVELSTRRDGTANRTEFYEDGALARAEEDTDGDKRVDKWEQYESGALISVSFDTAKSGKPTTPVDYRK
jgi:hypothetical protein